MLSGQMFPHISSISPFVEIYVLQALQVALWSSFRVKYNHTFERLYLDVMVAAV